MMKNRELDKWLAEKVMGWELYKDPKNHCKPYYRGDLIAENTLRLIDQSDWDPTASTSDAFQVVEKMVEDENSDFYEWEFELGNNHIKGPWYALFSLSGTGLAYCGFADSIDKIPLAICLAAKKAIEGKGG